MFRILRKTELAPKVKEFVVEAPLIAATAKPGNFVLVRGDERGERIPLTIADSDADAGAITLVMQEVGRGTIKLGAFNEFFFAVFKGNGVHNSFSLYAFQAFLNHFPF